MLSPSNGTGFRVGGERFDITNAISATTTKHPIIIPAIAPPDNELFSLLLVVSEFIATSVVSGVAGTLTGREADAIVGEGVGLGVRLGVGLDVGFGVGLGVDSDVGGSVGTRVGKEVGISVSFEQSFGNSSPVSIKSGKILHPNAFDFASQS